MTKKIGLINRLSSLSAAEKETVSAFFDKNPVYENRIDWNNTSLTYGDFEKVFEDANASRKKIKRDSKLNPALLFDGYNCRIVKQTKDYLIVTPLDWECAVFFNSFNCGGERAKWCIGDKRNFNHWNKYISEGVLFYLLLFTKEYSDCGRKIIFEVDKKNSDGFLWNAENKNISFELTLPKSIRKSIIAAISEDIKSLHDKDLPREVDLEHALNFMLHLADVYGCRCPQLMAAAGAFFRFTDDKYDELSKSQIEDISNTLKAIDEKIKEKSS